MPKTKRYRRARAVQKATGARYTEALTSTRVEETPPVIQAEPNAASRAQGLSGERKDTMIGGTTSEKCDKFLSDHEDSGDVDCFDPRHRNALKARRTERGEQWGQIVRGRDGGGSRDFLDGKPIQCGAVLELQVTESREDDFGSYTCWRREGVAVSFELEPDKRITLYALVGGISFSKPHEEWMRFRWPSRSR
jgi:hypothetical protein